MEEDFLADIDMIHKKYCKKNKIGNRYFICYLPLESVTIPVSEKLYIAKGERSRLLINHNNIWVDLTDYDIIDLICDFDDECVLQILHRLKACYDGKWTDFEFEIQRQTYKGRGVDYEGLDMKREIYLEADFSICFGDFWFIMNMVLFKDIVGQKYVERKSALSLIEKTLIKYITLVLYYKFNNPEAAQYLERIEYPVVKKDELLKYKMKMKKFDRYFNKKGFEENVKI